MAGDNIKTLVRMANQIADFFTPYSEEEGASGVQKHIISFWSPTMRRDLTAHVEHGGEGLRPAVLMAFERIARGESPIERAADPAMNGQLASDAG
jgi:formate dehydrogenase subunit delta